ncbi:hypothetical protein [Paraburkholderia sp. GAS42]|uniref:hypothetical protein n=1 Tax=Paraburkholderia sp. GAS42 TaxID=3035135 RepID=UPI003D1D532A
MTAFHGQAEGERLARAKYSSIPKGTFSGWLKQARLPAEPPSLAVPCSAAATGGDAAPLTFEERIARIDQHVRLIVTQCTGEVVDPATGVRTVKAKNPVVLGQAVRLQVQAAELLTRRAESVWTTEKLQEWAEGLIECIAGVVNRAGDRQLAEQIFAAMQAHDKRWAGTGIRFGIAGRAPSATPALEGARDGEA